MSLFFRDLSTPVICASFTGPSYATPSYRNPDYNPRRVLLASELKDELTRLCRGKRANHSIQPRAEANANRHAGWRMNESDCKFEVLVDVQQFHPKDISVKVEDGFLVVEAKHEEKQDEHGFVSRQFRRRYKLPAEVLAETFSPSLSSDGMLRLVALKIPSATPVDEPAKTAGTTSKERIVTIEHTGKPARKEESATKKIET